MARKAPPHTRLEAAKAAHDAAEREIAQLEAKRNDALLADRDDEAASLADQIETLRRLIRGHQDKIALLQAEAQRLEGERAAKQKQELIERIEKKFVAREAIGAELTAAITAADVAMRKLIDIGNDIVCAWPWRTGDEDVAAYLVHWRVIEIIKQELFRVGARPFLGGTAEPMCSHPFQVACRPAICCRDSRRRSRRLSLC